VQAYLVRLKKNKEVVGLFVSPSSDNLWEFVDECCPPVDCEYLMLPPGGLYLSAAGAAAIPTAIDAEGDEPDPDFFSGATVSELWLDHFYDNERGQLNGSRSTPTTWTRCSAIYPDNDGHPLARRE
jgi:hypothetical protein